MWYKKIILLLMMAASYTLVSTQKIALENNLLMVGMASPNLAAEFKHVARATLEILVSLNLCSFPTIRNLSTSPCSPSFAGGYVCHFRDIFSVTVPLLRKISRPFDIVLGGVIYKPYLITFLNYCYEQQINEMRV